MHLISMNVSRTLTALFATATLLTAIGCGNEAQVNESTDHMKHLLMAISQYRVEFKKWPDKLDELKPVIGLDYGGTKIGGGKDLAELLKNPLTGDNPGYEYVKPADPDASSEGVVVLYQLRGGKRDASLKVGFGDGGVGAAP